MAVLCYRQQEKELLGILFRPVKKEMEAVQFYDLFRFLRKGIGFVLRDVEAVQRVLLFRSLVTSAVDADAYKIIGRDIRKIQ